VPGTIAPAQAVAANNRERFSRAFAHETGLDLGVVRAWVQAEGADTPNGTGGFNYLNVHARPAGSYSGVAYAGISPRGFAQFASPEDAAREAGYWVNHFHQYTGIRRASTRGPAAQLNAIAQSPWDATHYQGGRSLARAYAAVRGGGGVLSGVVSGAEGVAGAIVHPGRTIEHGFQAAGDAVAGGVRDAASFALEGLLKVVLLAVTLGLAAALFYNGVRRLSGDRLPSGADLARTAAATRAPELSPESAALFAA
jgi:hypothetical protein